MGGWQLVIHTFPAHTLSRYSIRRATETALPATMCDLIGEWRAPPCMHSAVMPACADGPQPPADHAWVLLLLPLLAGLVGHWRLRRDNLQLRRQLAQAEAHHLKEVARLQHARDAGVKALCGKLKAANNRAQIEKGGREFRLLVAAKEAKKAAEALALSEVERSLLQQKLALAQEAEQLAVSRHKEADALSIFMLVILVAVADGVNSHLKYDVSKLFATPWSATQYNTYMAAAKTEFLPGCLLGADDCPAAFKDAITRLIESDMLQPEA